MDWIINQKQSHAFNHKKSKKKKKRDNYTKIKLRYCLDCKKTWEISTSGSILFYDHLPTYGLQRRICHSCNNLSIKAYKQKRREDDNV